MAGSIKGITIEFAGDTSKLDRSLRDVDKSTRAIDKELQNVNRSLKFNPTSIELWRQKQDLLKQKINETKDRLDILKQKQRDMDARGVDKNSEEYRKLQREIISTESKLKTFKGQLKEVGNIKLRVAGEQLKQLGAKATQAGQAMRGLSRAGTAVVAGIGALTYKSATWADELNTLSKQYSLSTKELQKYKAAADLVDVSVDDVAKSHVKMTKSMKSAQDGSKKQTAAFDKLGISITNSDGSLRDSDEVWQETIAALGKMTNETERDALAMELMGKSANKLNPLIEDGGETYKRVADTLKKYGLDFIDEKTLKNANDFNDSLDTIKMVGGLAFQQLGTSLASYLAPALEKVVGWFGKAAKWLSSIDPAIVAVVGAVSAMLAVASPLLIIFGQLATAVGTLLPMLTGLLSPVTLIAVGIGALVAVLAIAYQRSASFREAVNGLVQVLGGIFMSVVKSAISFLKQLFNVIVSTATEVATELAPVFQALMPVIKAVATFMAGRLKSSFNIILGVVKVLAAVIKSLATIFSRTFTTIVTVASGAVSKIKTVFGKVKDALTHPFETAKDIIKGIIDKIKGFFNFSVKSPHIPMPHFAISPSGWKVGDLLKGTIPKLKIDWYAKGGIFNSPTIAGIGEAGSEAVVPLDKFWDKLDKLSGGTNIVININGANASPKEIADEVKRSLIREVKSQRLAWQ